MFQRALLSCGNKKRFTIFTTVRSLSNELNASESEPVSLESVTSHLTKYGMTYQQGYACIKTTCPRFTQPKLKLNKLDQLYINKTTGFFVCANCKRSGPWEKLRDNISLVAGSLNNGKVLRPVLCFKNWTEDASEQSVYDSVSKIMSKCRTDPLEEEEFAYLSKHLKMDGIKQRTFTAYNVKVLSDKSGVILPSCNIDMVYIWAKTMSLKNNKLKTQTYPRTNYNGLFGWPVARNRKHVVLTSSEADAMAVYQETGVAAIALPRGISTLPQEALPLLEGFEKITLWFDNSVPAFESAKTFAKKLGESRTCIVRPEAMSPAPLQALQQGYNLKNSLSQSISLLQEHVISFGSRRSDVKHELILAEHVAGIKWKYFHKLTELMKGHRRGELTVFTGSTGSGKTTFLSEYSLDLCSSGVNTLWGSFEITNIKLMKTMIQQFARKDLSQHISEYDEWADQFELLPMYFMNFHGQQNIRKVIETMSHAVYIYDIAHVIVDNLQFMMGSLDSRYDRFSKQDEIVGIFRQFATKMNCHVTLVIHPRKEDGEALSTNSIFGGAKASQEADNILILQTHKGTGSAYNKYLQITKNRFDGTLGSMRLKFDRSCKSFASKSKDSSRISSDDGETESGEKTEYPTAW